MEMAGKGFSDRFRSIQPDKIEEDSSVFKIYYSMFVKFMTFKMFDHGMHFCNAASI